MDQRADRARARRSEQGLVPIATVLLALVALGARSCGEAPAIALYPVELVDPAPDDPFDTDPLFAPAPLDCGDCRERTVQLVGGERVTIRGSAKPGLVLRRRDVDFLELSGHGRPSTGDSVDAADGSAAIGARDVPVTDVDDATPTSSSEGAAGPAAAPTERFAVYAVLGTTAREAWTAFAVEHAREFVLVELEGRPVDLIRPLGWSRGLRVGVFETEAKRKAYLQTMPFRAAHGRSDVE